MAGLKLYELTDELRGLEALLGDEALSDDERLDLTVTLSEAKMEIGQKIVAVAAFVKSLDAGAEAIDNEIKRLQARKKALDSGSDWLRSYILQHADTGQKYEDAKAKVSFRKSEAVEVLDVSALPLEYQRTKTTTEADKTAIKEAIKAGNTVQGAELVSRMSVTIK